MNINFTNIIRIISASILIAITFNYFSADRLNIFEKKVQLINANDSLINQLIIDTIKATPENNSAAPLPEALDPPKIESTRTLQKEEVLSETTEHQIIINEPLAITLEQAYKLFSQKILFIDARNKNDFDYSHIENAISLPVFQFDEYKLVLHSIQLDEPIVVYCNGPDCDMSDILAKKMSELGYKKLFIFKGGWEEWSGAKYPSEPVR